MEQTILFSHEGALSPAELNWETPLLYQGSTKLYDKTNDPARSFLSSVTIPRPIAQKLTAINGKCQLTQAHGIFRSAHVFSPKAEFIDGLERICYLEYKEKGLFVREYGGGKTAGYSAYYPLLCKQLRTARFEESEPDVFLVPESRVTELVDKINLLIQWRLSGKLTLTPVQEVDSFSIMKTQRFFFMAFWRMDNAQESRPQPKTDSSGDKHALSALLKRIADSCQQARSAAELQAVEKEIAWIKERLDFVEELCESRKMYFKRSEELGL